VLLRSREGKEKLLGWGKIGACKEKYSVKRGSFNLLNYSRGKGESRPSNGLTEKSKSFCGYGHLAT